MSNNETLKDIVAEMRLGSTGGLPFAYRIGRPNRIGETIRIDSVTVAELADRIEAACQREAALLIPAKNIEFFDGNGRRLIASGWVKKGGAE